MINANSSMAKNALNLGALTGLLLAVIQLLLFVSGLGEISSLEWILYIILIVSISWGNRKYRDVAMNGYMSYGQCLGFGVLLSIGASVVFAFFMYLYAKFMHPEFIPQLLEQMEMAMFDSGMLDDQVELSMNLYKQYLSPGLYAFGFAFSYVFMGFLISLLTSIFIKNPNPMFDE